MGRQGRPLHDMGGATGPADTGGRPDATPEEDGTQRRPAPIGKGGTANVAGNDEQQPEIAEGPVAGVQPGEGEERTSGHGVTRELDPPGPPRTPDRPVPPDAVEDAPAALDPERARPADPAADPEDEGLPDLADGSPAAEQAADPQRPPVPGDRPVAAESFGVTGAEQAEGESLDDRLAAERPEVWEGGRDEEEERPGQSAEEAAMREEEG
ncbi:hypothetical protein Kpho02_57570 [Kitasatospora phosalacinea]|uniref:Uncharacterized protein n=1 Tax=Kitasatospora phosalacinea TaxID=2065 RepID=A0A9W6V4N3_9ACTN|nr:hypothetical protein [Kitasatospora phosalacinea]GLW73458.1 hypothetical protein Kpho02_57570 [Kitasatospora phosalacinea]